MVFSGCAGGGPGAAVGVAGGADPPPTTSAAAASPSPTPSASPTASASPARSKARCTIFPADNVWHADVSRLPRHSRSAAWIGSIGATRNAHPDFGSGRIDGAPFGIPVTTVPASPPRTKVTFEYAEDSDRGPYPLPRNARIEGGANADGDRHVILYDPARCRAHELYDAYPKSDGSWRAGSGAVFDLRSNRLRPAGYTSADAAGLSILGGLIRYEEVAAGRIDHAIRITAPRTRDQYIWPARHNAGASDDPALPPMGARFRLKASVDVSRFPRQARIVAEALKRYGAILADNGSAWYLSGTEDSRWNNDALGALKDLQGSDFEAVDASRLMVSPNSGAVRR
jgi:hypothetical protein